MKPLLNMGIFFMCMVSLVAGQTAGEINERLLPPVKKLERGSSTLALSNGFIISAVPELQNEANLLKDYLQEYAGLKAAAGAQSTGAQKITLIQQGVPLMQALLPGMAEQEPGDSSNTSFYALHIEDGGITISSAGKAGVFYGVQTLRQLLQLYGANLPHLTILDWPDFAMRGITDDMSRGQVSTMENFKEIIRFLASLKMNVYMPYIEDIFRFESMPAIGRNRGAVSTREWRELQEYAKTYHVEVIPIFQTLGHYENILLQKEYVGMAEFPGAASLNIANEEIYTFLEKALDEVTAAFDSPWFHIGADESWDVGKYATRAEAERHSIATVHARHYRRVYDMVRARGKKVMMYGDIVLKHPEILNQIPDDLVMFDWHYYPTYHYPSVETFAKAGQPIIVSPGIHNWRNIFPRHSYALENIYQLSRDGFENNAMGAITSNWGDYGAMNLRELNYYGNAFAAATAWQHDYNDFEHFENNFMTFYYGDTSGRIAAAYNLLDQMSYQVEWLKIIAHPFHASFKSDLNVIRESAGLNRSATAVKRLIKNAKPVRNAHHLDYLAFSADAYGWYGRLSALRLQMLDAAKSRPMQEQLDALRTQAVELGLEASQMGTRFADLWKRSNRPDNARRMQDLWERLSRYMLAKSEDIADGRFSFDGTLPGIFVTYPTAKEQEQPRCYLRHTFKLDDVGEKAQLQLIANSHATVYLNGKEIGSVMARKSLSALVEEARVKTWEVSDELRDGENVIAVEVHNYTSGVASAHVWLQQARDGEWQKPLMTSHYWKAADRVFEGWKGRSFDDSNWPNAVDAEIPWEISRPYFNLDLPSRIEYYSRGGH